MNIIEKIKENFAEVIDAKFEKEFGENVLRVSINETTLDGVEAIAKKMLHWMDEQKIDRTFLLDVSSRGTDLEVPKDEWKLQINTQVKVKLNRIISNKLLYEGLLEKIDDQNIYIRWNAKGQFRLQGIPKADILSITKSAKLER